MTQTPTQTTPDSLQEIAERIPELAPLDEHNRELVSNAHPPEWKNPQPAKRYNLVVIGGGTAGLVAAAGAAGLGAKVALVERELMGGDCLNVGCVPSKALLRCGRAVADVRDAGQFGVSAGEPSVAFAAIMQRMRRLRAKISPHDSVKRFSDELGWMCSWVTLSSPVRKRLKWTGRRCGFPKPSLPPERAPRNCRCLA